MYFHKARPYKRFSLESSYLGKNCKQFLVGFKIITTFALLIIQVKINKTNS
jgi:hypothetical protein